jgi:hypothetical protein
MVEQNTELLSIAQFQEELRRATRFCPRPAVLHALAAVVQKIERNPAHAESRLLTRILAALTYQEGRFRRAEAATLDVASLQLAVTLMDEHAAGTSAREDWVRAVNSTMAAQGEGQYRPASSPNQPPIGGS